MDYSTARTCLLGFIFVICMGIGRATPPFHCKYARALKSVSYGFPLTWRIRAAYLYNPQYCSDTLSGRQLYVGEVFTRSGQCVRVQCLGTLQLWEDRWACSSIRASIPFAIAFPFAAARCRAHWRAPAMSCRPPKPMRTIPDVVPCMNARRTNRMRRASWNKRIRMIILVICANHMWPSWLWSARIGDRAHLIYPQLPLENIRFKRSRYIPLYWCCVCVQRILSVIVSIRP